jgi:hypothetical protein
MFALLASGENYVQAEAHTLKHPKLVTICTITRGKGGIITYYTRDLVSERAHRTNSAAVILDQVSVHP